MAHEIPGRGELLSVMNSKKNIHKGIGNTLKRTILKKKNQTNKLSDRKKKPPDAIEKEQKKKKPN